MLLAIWFCLVLVMQPDTLGGSLEESPNLRFLTAKQKENAGPRHCTVLLTMLFVAERLNTWFGLRTISLRWTLWLQHPTSSWGARALVPRFIHRLRPNTAEASGGHFPSPLVTANSSGSFDNNLTGWNSPSAQHRGDVIILCTLPFSWVLRST